SAVPVTIVSWPFRDVGRIAGARIRQGGRRAASTCGYGQAARVRRTRGIHVAPETPCRAPASGDIDILRAYNKHPSIRWQVSRSSSANEAQSDTWRVLIVTLAIQALVSM